MRVIDYPFDAAEPAKVPSPRVIWGSESLSDLVRDLARLTLPALLAVINASNRQPRHQAAQSRQLRLTVVMSEGGLVPSPGQAATVTINR
jgi:hypothetical protein